MKRITLNGSALWMTLFLFTACGGLKEATNLYVVVRDSPRQTIETAPVNVTVSNGQSSKVFRTDSAGYLALTARDFDKGVFDMSKMLVSVEHDGRRAMIATNKYNSFYDVYMKPVAVLDSNSRHRVADMHYHVSLKAYNAFGNDIFPLDGVSPLPDNYNWLRVNSKLNGFDNMAWSRLKPDKLNDAQRRRYLHGRWLRSREGANKLKDYTEATFPHLIEGNVYLAFNAISPFEHSLANDWLKQFLSSVMKTGADIQWLKIMGDKQKHITHWRNFNAEYNMIDKHKTTYNNFTYRTLGNKDNLDSLLNLGPVVMNVVEGAHILQDKYWPHAINYDLLDSNASEKKALFPQILSKARRFQHQSKMDSIIYKKFEANRGGSISTKDSLVNWVLKEEVRKNVLALKEKNIHMISISHLSYNGMTGHAPALDVSKKPLGEAFTSYLAKRAFGIRVSNDKQYKKSYDGLFFRVPGLNQFGEAVINDLLDISRGGRIIHIDLKHADVPTRHYILDRYAKESLKTPDKKMSPMCSHCAVNGLSINYTSPLLNEYSLLKSSLARKFYPFAINLYNEEVEQICSNDGIIGIPLEERVLGGYINNRQAWNSKIIKKDGKYVEVNTSDREKRFRHTRKALEVLRTTDEFKKLRAFYVDSLREKNLYPNVIDENDMFDLICEEYCSAEPFLQNVFHIVDIAGTIDQEVKSDSVRQKVNEQVMARNLRAGKWEPRITKNFRAKQTQMRPVADTMGVRVLDRQLMNQSRQEVIDSVYHDPALRASYIKLVDSLSKRALDSIRVVMAQQLEMQKRKRAWANVCLGSDFDGMIDPINICPSASQYPDFKNKLEVMIPLFIEFRRRFEIKDKLLPERYKNIDHYFNNDFTIQNALDMLFYTNLKDFSIKNFGS